MITILLASLTMLIFIISCAITGILMYRLGLNGRITRMVEDAESEKNDRKVNKEPTAIPGEEFNPFVNDYQPRYYQPYDIDMDEEEEEESPYLDNKELDEQTYESDPVIPGVNKAKVVMTGGS